MNMKIVNNKCFVVKNNYDSKNNVSLSFEFETWVVNVINYMVQPPSLLTLPVLPDQAPSDTWRSDDEVMDDTAKRCKTAQRDRLGLKRRRGMPKKARFSRRSRFMIGNGVKTSPADHSDMLL